MIGIDIDVGTWISETRWDDDREPTTGLLVLVGTVNETPKQYAVSVACPYPPTGHTTMWGRFSW